MAAVNIVLMALGTATLGSIADLGALRFAGWWIALLALGGIVPAVALATIARRSRHAVTGLTLWMLVALFALFGFAINSGGGV